MKTIIYCRKSSESEERQVLSLDAQESELMSELDGWPEAELSSSPYRESMSAKSPGRPIFNSILVQVESGEVDAILAYHPDRLARNPMDGARLIHMLATGALRELRFSTFRFENTPEGRLLLMMLFAQATHYVENLSRGVRRGIKAKLEKGGLPGAAPLGYLNCKETKDTLPDPERFEYVKRALRRFAEGRNSAKELLGILNNRWGVRTVQRKTQGGRPIVLSGLYRILANPFYAGLIVWKGETFEGKHRPMISLEEHEAILIRLGKKKSHKPSRHRFAYTGLIRCGECGRMVTAERKTNRHGTAYVYYHCTRRRPGPVCKQRVISLAALEEQITGFVKGVAPPPAIERFALERLGKHADAQREEHEARAKARTQALSGISSQLKQLTSMRMRELIDDGEFRGQKALLIAEKRRIEAEEEQEPDEWIEPARKFVSLSVHAPSVFQHADDGLKRKLFEFLGSNPTLKDRKLSVDAAFPIFATAKLADDSYWRALRDNVRTLAQSSVWRSKVQSLYEAMSPLLKSSTS